MFYKDVNNSADAFDSIIKLIACNIAHDTVFGYPVKYIKEDLEFANLVLKKDVNIQMVGFFEDSRTYNSCTLGKKLTKKEYALLRRVWLRHQEKKGKNNE